MYELKQTPYFSRAFKRFAKRHPELKDTIQETLRTLIENPFAPSLRLHNLTGKLAGQQSVSINYSYRIILCLEILENEITLHNIGTHDEVYG